MQLDEKHVALIASAAVYGVSFVYASYHTLLRIWIKRLGRRVQPRDEHSQQLLNDTLSLDEDTPRPNMMKVAMQISVGLACRIIWILCTVLNVAPKPPPEVPACHDPHVGVAAVNRFTQLLLFSAYSSVVTFWADIHQRYEWNKIHQELENGQEIAVAVARSTVLLPSQNSYQALFHRTNPSDVSRQRSMISNVGPLQVTAHSAPSMGFSLLCKPHYVQVLMNFWMYLIVGSLVLVQWFSCDRLVYDNIYESETVVIAVFYVFLSLQYTLSGVRLYKALGQVLLHRQGASTQVGNYNSLDGSQDNVVNSNTDSILCIIKTLRMSTASISAICVVVFTIRGVLFLLRPVFGIELVGVVQQVMYPWFFYTIPEILPSLCILVFSRPPKHPKYYEQVPNMQTPLVATSGTQTVFEDWI